jgi:condensin complex subunit 3
MTALAERPQTLTPVQDAFTACQKTVACHKKYILSLERERKQDPAAFGQQFKQSLHSILTVFKREPAVERLVAFTSKFVAVDDENGAVDSAFAVELIEHLLPHARAKDKAVRLRVCQLVGAILGSMGENLDVDDDLWDEMMEQMLTRCRDKVPSVRAAATLAVSFFQDPEEADDPVVLELIRLMGTDAAKDVRKTALQHIAITRATLPHVMRRLRDNKADVRKLLYQVIAWKLPVKKLNISLRCEILTAGLGERTPTVREACVDLLCNTWLRDNLSSDPFKLLVCLDAEVNEEIATTALQAVFDRHLKSRKRTSGAGPTDWDTIANAKLSAATSGNDQIAAVEAMYLRVRAEWCKQQRGGMWQDVLDRLLLDLSSMTELCNYHYQQCKTPADASEAEQTAAESDIFVTRQLLVCIAKADFGDEGGRRTVVDMIRGMLQDTDTPPTLLEDAMLCMKAAAMGEEEYIRAVVEVISELKEPLEAEEDEDDDAVLLEQTWLQCLDMASGLLKTTQRSLSNGQVKGLETTLLLPAVMHREASVRDRGVLALGQYCLLDKEVATRYLMLFLQAARNDIEVIQHTAMKVLYDMLFAFNLAAVETDATDDAEPSTVQAVIMATLVPFLSSSSEELRTTAVEGACKLMLSSRISDPQLLSRLLILFYNPTTVEDVRAKKHTPDLPPRFIY